MTTTVVELTTGSGPSTVVTTPVVPAGGDPGSGDYGYIPNHAELAQEKLIEFFRQPRNRAVVEGQGDQVQIEEDALRDLFDAFDPASAENAALDYLGSIVGELRNDRVDSDYRAAVRARILVNISSGKIEEMYSILLAMDPTMTAIIAEYYPAAYSIQITSGFSGVSFQTVYNLMREAKPAGVRLELVMGPGDIGAEDDDPLGGTIGSEDDDPLGFTIRSTS